MPTYKVLRTIEHNNRIYFPASDSGPRTPDKLPSGGHGKDAPTDTSGVIMLTEEEAAAIAPEIHGQIPVCEGKPDSVEAQKARETAAKRGGQKK